LFDDKYKKSIPKMPRKIGIITAPTGAAIRDILSTIKRRYPICETILFPSLVQGENAKDDIVRNLRIANTYDLDVIILGRGGGSIEDLWPFNEEIVAREIFESRIPIISAVGHEVDFTIADFVADLRAPTPTGAAEMAVPNMVDLINHIKQLTIRLSESVSKRIKLDRLKIDRFSNSIVIKNPMIMIDNKKQKVDLFKESVIRCLNLKLDKSKNELIKLKESYVICNPECLYKDSQVKLFNLIDKLDLVNPLGVLKRGYCISRQDDKVISKINDVNIKKPLIIRLQDGEVETEVKNIKESING